MYVHLHPRKYIYVCVNYVCNAFGRMSERAWVRFTFTYLACTYALTMYVRSTLFTHSLSPCTYSVPCTSCRHVWMHTPRMSGMSSMRKCLHVRNVCRYKPMHRMSHVISGMIRAFYVRNARTLSHRTYVQNEARTYQHGDVLHEDLDITYRPHVRIHIHCMSVCPYLSMYRMYLFTYVYDAY
jgi:hypothetical protein